MRCRSCLRMGGCMFDLDSGLNCLTGDRKGALLDINLGVGLKCMAGWRYCMNTKIGLCIEGSHPIFV